MNIKRLLLTCFLLLPGSVVLAQQEPVVEGQDLENRSENQSESPSAERSENQNENPQNETVAVNEETETSTSGDEDFVPTVQISEDLSVSFPVDI